MILMKSAAICVWLQEQELRQESAQLRERMRGLQTVIQEEKWRAQSAEEIAEEKAVALAEEKLEQMQSAADLDQRIITQVHAPQGQDSCYTRSLEICTATVS